MSSEHATGTRASGLDGLADQVPDMRLITDPDLIGGYVNDQVTTLTTGRPRAVALPRSTRDVTQVMQWATRHRVPVVPRGAGTGLAGGATAIDECLIVCLSQMRTIHEVDPGNRLAVVQAGVVTADIDRAAHRVGLMYPPDPGSVDSCTIGGNIATNAGGLRCVKYGVTRDSVLGLQVVLADGRVLATGGRTVKNVAGYDLTRLFTGSEGTLGVITGATVRLQPLPAHDPVTLVAGFGSLTAAADAVTRLLRSGARPSLLELMDHAMIKAIDNWKHMGLGDAQAMLIAQFDSPDADQLAGDAGRIFTAAGADDVAISADQAESAQLLELRRLAYPAAERLGHCLVEDIGVPVSRLADMVRRIEQASRRHHVQIVTVAHAGDGNLHPTFVFAPVNGNVPQPVWDAADEIFHAALELGGTLTGEHGVGLLKQRWLPEQVGAVGTFVNRAIKNALDPMRLLNPGRAI